MTSCKIWTTIPKCVHSNFQCTASACLARASVPPVVDPIASQQGQAAETCPREWPPNLQRNKIASQAHQSFQH
eukprot:2227595-Amphidinium_carterae.6